MTSGWQGATFFRKYGKELVSKPVISLKKSWVGLSLNDSTVIMVCYGAGSVKDKSNPGNLR